MSERGDTEDIGIIAAAASVVDGASAQLAALLAACAGRPQRAVELTLVMLPSETRQQLEELGLVTQSAEHWLTLTALGQAAIAVAGARPRPERDGGFDNFCQALREAADIVVEGVAPAGALDITEVLATRSWFDFRLPTLRDHPPAPQS